MMRLYGIAARERGGEGDGGPPRKAHGFDLRAGGRVLAHQRPRLERLCRSITRPPLFNERLTRLDEEWYRLQLESPWSDGTSPIVLSSSPPSASTRLWEEMHEPRGVVELALNQA